MTSLHVVFQSAILRTCLEVLVLLPRGRDPQHHHDAPERGQRCQDLQPQQGEVPATMDGGEREKEEGEEEGLSEAGHPALAGLQHARGQRQGKNRARLTSLLRVRVQPVTRLYLF